MEAPGPISQLPIYNVDYQYQKADGSPGSLSVPLFEIPAGTLLFRGVQLPNPKKDEDPRLFVRDWLGYPRGDRFCMTPTHNTFFYTTPYVPFGAHTVGDWFNAIMVYQTVKDLRVVSMISPSKMTRGGKEIKSLGGGAPIQRCDKFDYSCFESKTAAEAKKEKELKAFDNCINPTFAAETNTSGWMAIADYDSLDNFKEGLKGKNTTMGKYIIDLDKRLPGKGIELLTSTYTDGTNHRGFPEVVLFPWSPHPGTENQYTEARTEEDAADAIAEMSDRFNYLPIACITERGIVEAFTGDFKAGDLPRYATTAVPGALTRKTIDRLQAQYLDKLTSTGVDIEGLGNARAKFDSRTGFYVMDAFTGSYQTSSFTVKPYTDFLFEYETREDKEKVLEYKVKYRTFFLENFGQDDSLLDGNVVRRNFVFDRPPELYEQFKELDLRFPAKLIPYIWEATERFQLNTAERKAKADPRGAEEARRRAAEAKEKIKESLAIIAKKKEEIEKKKGKKPEEKKEAKVPTPKPQGPKTPEMPPQKVITYKYLNGVQSTIPVVRTMEEAIDIGMDALQQPNLLAYSEYDDGLNANTMTGPWKINEETLRKTVKYIYEIIHANCYLLCVRDTQPYLFKLEPRGLASTVRKVLEEDIQEKGITDINLDNTRVMQCIIKPYAEDSTVATEWLTFLQNPLNRKYLLPNGIFILNLSDSVLLRRDRNEPFEILLPNPVPLAEEFKGRHLPIFSYSGKNGYVDIPIPTFDDIETVMKENTFGEGTLIFQMYEKDINKAVFRGSTTGCGATSLNNQRLKLTSSEFLNSLKNKDMLDVGITKVTKQYKFDPEFGLSKVDPNTPIVAPLTYAEQSHYKYIIHVDGNVFAYRLLKTMLLGSCILRVFSSYSSWLDVNTEYGIHGYDIDTYGQNIDATYADPYLCHFIWVKDDLSNLDQVLDFCNEHEDIVNIIAKNGRDFAGRVLDKKYLFASFVNLLAASVDISTMAGGGSKRKRKGTMKRKIKKQKTRKQKKQEQKLELAIYRGGGIEEDMKEYIQGTMQKMWKGYIKRLNR